MTKIKTLTMFTSSSCGPCRAMKTFDEKTALAAGVLFERINVTEQPDRVPSDIASTPTLILAEIDLDEDKFDLNEDGKPVWAVDADQRPGIGRVVAEHVGAMTPGALKAFCAQA